MIDGIFWCINTGVLIFLGYYGYKKSFKASLEQQLFLQKEKKTVLMSQVNMLQDACLRIQKETDEQESKYRDLRDKIALWRNKVSVQNSENEAHWLTTKEVIEEKRAQQRAYDAHNRYQKEVIRAVVTQTTHELRRMFHDKNKGDAYAQRVIETMKHE